MGRKSPDDTSKMMGEMMPKMMAGMGSGEMAEMMPQMMDTMGPEAFDHMMEHEMPRMMDSCFSWMTPERRGFMLTHCRGLLDQMEEEYVRPDRGGESTVAPRNEEGNEPTE